MAEIKDYSKERASRGYDDAAEEDYRVKIRRHRAANMYRLLLIIGVCAGFALLLILQFNRHVYTEYEVIDVVETDGNTSSTDLRLGSSILTYSKDGAHARNDKGEVTWNQTYGLQDVLVSINGGTTALAGYNDREIYVANEEGIVSDITTAMPIKDVTVSEDGKVSAVLVDTLVTWIETYGPDGTKKYSGQTHMSNSGYPVALSLSPNGVLLGVAYVYVDAGVVKTSVAFYNFGDVGENSNDYMVSAYPYTDILVPMVRFMNNETCFAVGDSRLMMYKGAQKPEVTNEFLFDEEVVGVYYSEDYVGLVFNGGTDGGKYRMKVYSSQAKEIGTFDIGIDYNDIFFEEDGFVAYNDKECRITTLKGYEKFSGEFNEAVRLMAPTKGAYRYKLVTDSEIKTVQLR
ncbi:MAG: hypothetical protein J6033_05230 [Lachnospiraceae bacterium]|nr:hypothetical protein [Lachnospiraceae bacterium]